MSIKNSVWIVLGVVSLLTASSLAVYYQQQAARYQREWSAAAKELDRIAHAAPPAAAAIPEAKSRSRTIDIQWDAGQGSTPRREADPQVSETDKAEASTGMPPPRLSEADRFGRRGADWMENLRTNDPERYAEMQQRRQERQQSLQNAWMQATNYFMSRDTSKMPPADVEEYNTMITLLGQAWALNQQLQSGLPPDARQQAISDLRSNVVAIVPLLDNERNREYYDAAVSMGQSEQDAATMVNYINQITSNTSLRTVLPGVRVGGMGGGPPFGGNPPASAPAAGK